MADSEKPATTAAKDEPLGADYVENYKIDGEYMYDDDLELGEFSGTEHIDKVLNMTLDSNDIVVASYPKTGTTLLQEVIWLLRYQADEEKAKVLNTERVPYVDDSYFDGVKIFYALEHPRHLKTHLPYRYLPKDVAKKNNKVIYIYRNPKDTLISYYFFYKMVLGLGFFKGTWDNFFDYFYRVKKGRLYYGNLLKHYLDYWEHRDDPNMLITTYENLVRHPSSETKRIAEFANVKFDDTLIEKVMKATTFATMKANPATNYEPMAGLCKFEISPFMRKGKIGDWKNYFTEDQSEKVDRMVREVLGDSGIEFIYE